MCVRVAKFVYANESSLHTICMDGRMGKSFGGCTRGLRGLFTRANFCACACGAVRSQGDQSKQLIFVHVPIKELGHTHRSTEWYVVQLVTS